MKKSSANGIAAAISTLSPSKNAPFISKRYGHLPIVLTLNWWHASPCMNVCTLFDRKKKSVHFKRLQRPNESEICDVWVVNSNKQSDKQSLNWRCFGESKRACIQQQKSKNGENIDKDMRAYTQPAIEIIMEIKHPNSYRKQCSKIAATRTVNPRIHNIFSRFLLVELKRETPFGIPSMIDI